MSKRHNLWERVFCFTPVIAQTQEQFTACQSGYNLIWLRYVWRQDIVRSSYTHKEAMYRYVDAPTNECPQPGYSVYDLDQDYYGNSPQSVTS